MKICGVILTSQTREAVIGKCLESIIRFVDRIIIVELDGAVIWEKEEDKKCDRTFDIAREICGDKLTIRHWKEFGDPRLYHEGGPHFRERAMMAANETDCDWCIHIDTDEWMVEARDDVPFMLEGMPPTIDVVQLWKTGRTFAKPVFFRLPTTGRGEWKHLVHETFNHVNGIARIEGLFFDEQPKTAEQIRIRSEQDLPFLIQESEAAPDNFRWIFYLGTALDCVGRTDDAIQVLRTGLTRDITPTQKACLLYTSAHYLFLQEKPDAALMDLSMAMFYSPLMAEVAWLAAVICYGYGRFDDARVWLNLVEVTKDVDLDIMFRAKDQMIQAVEGIKKSMAEKTVVSNQSPN